MIFNLFLMKGGRQTWAWMVAGAVLVVMVWIQMVYGRSEEGFTSANEVLQEWLTHISEQKNQLGNGRPEVFQVGPEKFTYEMAQERCQRYGGRLATKEEVDAVYAKGAHWCRKGWIRDGKVAWIKGLEEDGCPAGAPGVYTETYPNAVRFAATCYAPRPKPGVHWQKEVERQRKQMEAERMRKEAEASVQFVATLRHQMEQDQRTREDMMKDEIAPFNRTDLIWGESS